MKHTTDEAMVQPLHGLASCSLGDEGIPCLVCLEEITLRAFRGFCSRNPIAGLTLGLALWSHSMSNLGASLDHIKLVDALNRELAEQGIG